MQTIIIIPVSEDLGLNEDGNTPLTDLASMLMPHVEGRVAIISPQSIRAGAEIIASGLEVKFVSYNDVLCPKLECGLLRVSEFVYSVGNDTDCLVVVTSYFYAEHLPKYYGLMYLGVDCFPQHRIAYGSAWVIDCPTSKIEHISPTS